MRVGLWFDMRNPPAWRRSWAELYGRTLERVEEAERLGLRSVWLSEHHLFEDGYLPQPLTLAAAIAARTKEVRIGTAVLLAPLRKPVDIAEQAAIVDILSNGRLELGLGAGYAPGEFEIYGVDVDRRHRLLRAAANEVPRLWEEGKVTPPPVQSAIPLWIGALGPQLSRFAGSIGAGLLSVNPALIEIYREALAAAGRDPATARCSGNPQLLLADDPEAAWRKVSPHLKWSVESYGRIAQGAGSILADKFATEIDPEALRARTGAPSKPFMDVVTPEEAVERIRPWAEALPLFDMIFYGDFAGLDADLLDRHVELVAEHVVPAFAGAPAVA